MKIEQLLYKRNTTNILLKTVNENEGINQRGECICDCSSEGFRNCHSGQENCDSDCGVCYCACNCE